MTTELSPHILRSELFDEFTDSEQNSLQGMLEHRIYKAGETVLEEGAMDEDIYLLKSGLLDVTKFTGKSHQTVDEISGETYFGDQAFLDGSPRSASIKTKVETELFILSKQAVLEHPDHEKLLNKLYRNIAMINSIRLKHSASSYAVTMEKEINLLTEKTYFDKFIITIFICFAITQVVTSMIYSVYQNVNVFSEMFTWAYLIILVGPFIYFASKSGEPWSAFGVTLNNWKKALFEGILFSLGMIGIVVFGLIIVSYMGYLNLEDVTWQDLTKNFTITSPLYFFHSYGQEFVARGVLQNALQKFLNDQRGLKSVIMTAFIFGLSHILYGPQLIIASLISGIMFGLVFLRHKNLIGSTIVHFIMGMVAFSVPFLPFSDKM
jgi:CRP-like cAMP-binding protein/membrane protease YdiL (CAAX protease family)